MQIYANNLINMQIYVNDLLNIQIIDKWTN